MLRLKKEKDASDMEILRLKKELELGKKMHEQHCLKLEVEAKETRAELEKKLKEAECLLIESRKKVEELESFTETKSLRWKKKERMYRSFMDCQFGVLQVCLDFHIFRLCLEQIHNVFIISLHLFPLKMMKFYLQ